MSSLSFIEKNKLETLFQMGGGYVLDFSDRTMGEFVADSTGLSIYNAKYNYLSGSKANRLRSFWKREPDHVVGRLVSDLLEYCRPTIDNPDRERLFGECETIVARLRQSAPVDELDAITPEEIDQTFKVLATEIRNSITRNEPGTALDRLHTYVTKLVRSLAEKRGITAGRDKPLHGVFGEYVNALRESGLIESEMTKQILRSSGKTLEAFNRVRNEESLAHDNRTLNYDESLLVIAHVCAIVRFIRAVENRVESSTTLDSAGVVDDEFPF